MKAVVSARVGRRTALDVEWEGDEAFARIAEGSFCRETERVPRSDLSATLRRLADALDHGGEAEAARARLKAG